MKTNQNYLIEIHASNIEIFNLIYRTTPTGVTLIGKASSKEDANPTMAYDTAEDILNFIVKFSYDLDMKLLAAWLVSVLVQPGGDKTRINGKKAPIDQIEMENLIRAVIQIQKDEQEKSNSIENTTSDQ